MADFSWFDTRHYPTVPAREGYRDWAPTYESTVEDAMDIALLDRLSSVRWGEMPRAADLGCGTGRTGAWLRQRGVTGLDGVDCTPEMLEFARRRRIYDRLDAADVADTGLPGGAYPLVTCCLVDEHLRELGPLYAEARRLLRDTGVFVLVGFHPFFIMAAGMPTHFDHAEHGPVAIETHVHLFSEHFAAARGVGLTLRELCERVIDDEWLRLKPQWQQRRGWPISFAAVWQPAPAT